MPAGLSQKPLTDTSEPSESVALPWEKPTRADQKLVSLIDLPSGKLIMKRPSCELLHRPVFWAFEVQTYVFC